MNPDQFYQPNPEQIKKWEHIYKTSDIQLSPPPITHMINTKLAQDNPYDGQSLLRFSHKKVHMHPKLAKPTKFKQIPRHYHSYMI